MARGRQEKMGVRSGGGNLSRQFHESIYCLLSSVAPLPCSEQCLLFSTSLATMSDVAQPSFNRFLFCVKLDLYRKVIPLAP